MKEPKNICGVEFHSEVNFQGKKSNEIVTNANFGVY